MTKQVRGKRGPHASAGVEVCGLRVDGGLYALVGEEMVGGTGVRAEDFWRGLAGIVKDLGGRNRELLERRGELQRRIDGWYGENAEKSAGGVAEYRGFLEEIGYLGRGGDGKDGQNFKVEVEGVDEEVAGIAGAQLVVPLDNARYALNAVNARWVSLYGALYGSDVIAEEGGCERRGPGGGYNRRRGAQVIRYTQGFLDQVFPLASGRYGDAVGYTVVQEDAQRFGLRVRLRNGRGSGLRDAAGFAGWIGEVDAPSGILLRHHNLFVEVRFGGAGSARAMDVDAAGVSDVVVEAAVSAIMDCEDSVAAVDAEDKVRVYRNWLGLMKGDLTAEIEKGGKVVKRVLQEDREFRDARGEVRSLRRRALMFIRNVGTHMYTDAVTAGGEPIAECFLDAMVSALAAKHDLMGKGRFRNSQTGSVYVVKPKMHGAEEVAAAVELFGRVEEALGLEENTLKIGIMDEERRTTVNLRECIRAARARVVFINTGFLDRTGDEIHTCMEAGAVMRKEAMKGARWLAAYEEANVAVGLACGFAGRAQIGKGMWAAPDNLAAMMAQKGVHPRAGANTAWVPSPTAAALHALHYHEVDVRGRQEELMGGDLDRKGRLDEILTVPIMSAEEVAGLGREEVMREVENNAQGILGYVVRWVEQGVGCSKVPDIGDVELMEDRATLRISSQHIANWLRHGVVSEEEVRAVFAKMAGVVDRQNAGDADYVAMAGAREGERGWIAFQAALDLVFEGRAAENGYTEGVLHRRRREVKELERAGG